MYRVYDIEINDWLRLPNFEDIFEEPTFIEYETLEEGLKAKETGFIDPKFFEEDLQFLRTHRYNKERYELREV